MENDELEIIFDIFCDDQRRVLWIIAIVFARLSVF